MPAGGLFSTARDVAAFCRMLLNKGVHDGKRILSEQAVAQMTTKQTGRLPNGYGLGLSMGPGTFGHGGAWATSMNMDAKAGLATVWMVQHAGFPGDGNKAKGAFQAAARKVFAPKR